MKLLKSLQSNEDGATIMEFGLIAGPLMLIILGTIDLGYTGYLDTMAKSQLHEVARAGSTGALTVDAIKLRAKNGMQPLLLENAKVDTDIVSYFDFTNIGKPEKITIDVNNNGELDSGDCYLDGNGNDTFDTDLGTTGTGGPDDIVNYTITVDSPRLFPLAKMFGLDDRIKIVNSTAVRNQPYGDQQPIPEVCEA